jgi:carbon-monoxide dehydrogenase medium subunit
VAAVIGQTRGYAADEPVDDVRVAVTGVGDHPYRATGVEAVLLGTKLDAATLAAAVGGICDGISVQSDIHADSGYRSAMAEVMARRALEAARQRLFE